MDKIKSSLNNLQPTVENMAMLIEAINMLAEEIKALKVELSNRVDKQQQKPLQGVKLNRY